MARSTLRAGRLGDESSLIVAGEGVGMPTLLISKSRMGCKLKCVTPATSVDVVFGDWIFNCGGSICFLCKKLPGSSLLG